MLKQTAELSFQLYKPQPLFTRVIQAMWSASITPGAAFRGLACGESESPKSVELKKWLYGDVCSGLLMNMRGRVWLNDHVYNEGCIVLPVSKEAHTMRFSSDAQLAGIRLQPGVSFPFIDINNKQAYHLHADALKPAWLSTLLLSLDCSQTLEQRIKVLASYEADIAQSVSLDPIVLSLLCRAQSVTSVKAMCETIPLSQRQLERKCQQTLGMTLKKYQRIIRVRKMIECLRQDPYQSLVDVALSAGCTDQAHMIREFQAIANITPKQLCQFYYRA